MSTIKTISKQKTEKSQTRTSSKGTAPCIIPSVVCAHLSFFSSSSIDHRTLRAQFIKNWILYLSWMFLYLEKKHGTVFSFFFFPSLSEKSHFCHSINPCFSQLLTGQHSPVNCYTTLELPNWMCKRKFDRRNACYVPWKLQNNPHLPWTCTHTCHSPPALSYHSCPSFQTQFSSQVVFELSSKPISQSSDQLRYVNIIGCHVCNSYRIFLSLFMQVSLAHLDGSLENTLVHRTTSKSQAAVTQPGTLSSEDFEDSTLKQEVWKHQMM